MKNETKRKVIKSVIYPLVLATAISGYSNFKKEARYSSSGYSKSIIDEVSFDDELGSYVLQGGCTDGTYKFLTAYDNSDEENSIIITFNSENKIINKVTLGTQTHAGGITYDYNHGLIWVTDVNGTITAYDRQAIIDYGIDETNTYNENYKEPIEPTYNQIYIADEDMKSDCGNPTVSCITYADGKMYAANYSKIGKSKLRICNIRNDGSIDNINTKTVDFINYAQGLYFVEVEGTRYLVVNTSNGVCSDSILKFYRYDETIENYKDVSYKFYRMPPMAEGVFLDENNNVNIINESNANKYNLIADYFYNDVADLTVLHSDTLTKTYKYWK